MKKIIISFMLVLSIFISCVPAYANTTDTADIVFDSTEEILVNQDIITNDIIDSVKAHLNRDIKEADIDFSKAIRMYQNIEDKCPSLEDIKYLDKEECYYYALPVDMTDCTLIFFIDQTKEISDEARELLTPEDIEWLENRIDKWNPYGFAICPGSVDYKEFAVQSLKEKGIDRAEVHFAEYWSGLVEMEKTVICRTEDGEMVFDLRDAIPDNEEEEHYGWQCYDGDWFYLRKNGTYAVNCWEKIDGKWYHFDQYGQMQTGWVKTGGKWYYLSGDGAMKTGWVKDNGKWYYLSNSGAMKTGWVKVKGKWYYLNAKGAMLTGWQKIGKSW